MVRMHKNPSDEKYETIAKAINENDGYCICSINHAPETRCPCQAFLLQDKSGFCHCGRYYKVYDAPVVTLCGSTRFKEEFEMLNEQLTKRGCIVFSCGIFAHSDDISLTDKEKELLDEIHKKKIEMSDIIYVVNKDGYIGSSTQSEIEWARELGKQIIYLENKGENE